MNKEIEFIDFKIGDIVYYHVSKNMFTFNIFKDFKPLLFKIKNEEDLILWQELIERSKNIIGVTYRLATLKEIQKYEI